MSLSLRPHLGLPIVALAIALLLSALPSAAFAQGPRVSVAGSGNDICEGRPVASVRQGEGFSVGLSSFPTPAGGGVVITLTLPDGRVLSPVDPALFLGVPPAVNYAAPTPPPFIAGPLINAAFPYLSATTFPVGCYRVNVRQSLIGGGEPPPPFLTATATFRLLPRLFSNQAGNLRLSVQAAGTIQATGQQEVIVNIFGQGVPSTAAVPGVTIDIVQPNGAIITLATPPGTVAPDGSFNWPGGVIFNNLNQPGMHTVFATVTIPPPAGSPIGTPPIIYTARAQFNLTAPAVTVTNNASLEMLDRFSTLVPRNAPISIVGRGFNPNPPQGPAVGLALVLPNGVRLPGAVPVAPDGNVPIDLPALGRGFPTGDYRLIADQAAAAPFPRRTATLTWRLIP